ncbi:MAG: DUF1513 domain-containing protein [Planctomycetes bacterium]|nr:DUF1513 domain-containing protein [Planctomycetota bacterium]
MDHSRRSFIAAASAWVGLAMLAGCSGKDNSANAGTANQPTNTLSNDTPKPSGNGLDPTDRRGMLIGAGSRKKGADCWVALIDLDRVEKYASAELKPTLIPISFVGHAVVPHPVERHKAAVFEKWGPGACEIDLREMKSVRPITTAPDRMFYGHGAWAPDGNVLYSVESTDPALGPYDGFVVIRDGKTLAAIDEFPTFGKKPHDCHLLDGGKTLAITNGGGEPGSSDPGCVTFVDVQSRQLLERLTIPNLQAGHLAVSAGSRSDDLVVGSTPHSPPGSGPEGFKTVPGGLSLRASGAAKMTHASEPADTINKMLGETLSVVIHPERGIAGATNPAGNIVTFWDIKQAKLLKSFELTIARGIALTLDKRHFVVSYGTESDIVMIRADDLTPVEASRFKPSLVTGSHFITYDL